MDNLRRNQTVTIVITARVQSTGFQALAKSTWRGTVSGPEETTYGDNMNRNPYSKQQRIISPAPPMMIRSNAEETTLSTEMIDSCCSRDTGMSAAAVAASSTSARSIKLMDGGAAAESPRRGAARLAAFVCRAILDPHPFVSEIQDRKHNSTLVGARQVHGEPPPTLSVYAT